MQFGSFTLDLIQDGLFSLPPDALLGVFPQPRERILIGMNCLLVRSRERNLLIDTGVGSKPRRDFVERYEMEWPRHLMAELERIGLRPDDIDTVILTHLHWDHAGGATCLDDAGKPVPTFPRAQYFVQRKEWEKARRAGPESDDYLPEDFVPLGEAGMLTLLDGNAELFPGIEVRRTGGHSPGHQILLIGDSSERAVFLADLIPTAWMLSPKTMTSYDGEASVIERERRKVVQEAFENHWLLFFQHAPRQRAGYLKNIFGRIHWTAC